MGLRGGQGQEGTGPPAGRRWQPSPPPLRQPGGLSPADGAGSHSPPSIPSTASPPRPHGSPTTPQWTSWQRKRGENLPFGEFWGTVHRAADCAARDTVGHSSPCLAHFIVPVCSNPKDPRSLCDFSGRDAKPIGYGTELPSRRAFSKKKKPGGFSLDLLKSQQQRGFAFPHRAGGIPQIKD